ncbi:MAG: PIN domain-containing protein [Thermoleophilaceae bacterium]|nr:PIN domain-containing protein [Thermoleophilaceae bacterium]
MTTGLLDTSVFIAREQERELSSLPAQVAVSVVTLGELELGVLSADDDELRRRRADTLDLVRAADPLPVSEPVMSRFARLVSDCRREGVRAQVLDALIAATAVEHGLPVVTQDDDFEAMARAHGELRVVRV